MITKFMGIKEFRKNLTSLWKEAHKKNIRYIILNHSWPILEVKPFDEDQLIVEKWGPEIDAALEQAKKGKTYTQDEVMERFNVKKK